MITRRKAKLLQIELNLDKMSSNDSNITESSSVNEGGFEVNNQLGEPGVFDAVTIDNMSVDISRAGDNTRIANPVEPISGMQQLLAMITQKLDQRFEENKQQMQQFNQRFDKIEENIQQTLTENNQQIQQQMQQINHRFEQFEAHHQRVVADMSELRTETTERYTQLHAETQELVSHEVKEIRKTIEVRIKETRTLMSKGDKELGNQIEKVNRRVDDVSKEWNEREEQRIADGKEQQKKIEVRMTQQKEEMDVRLNKLQETQQELRVKIRNSGERPTTRNNPNESTRHITFNGAGRFPIEFLKELDEIREEYYEEGDVRWIAQHLEGDASVWWRIIKDKVKTYREFQDVFREKFWNHIIQEEVRDNLEFGQYLQSSGLTPIQYMERRVLENRQLTPPMTDAHLIKKVMRHFSKEVEIATITRGIRDITAFELLLREFMAIKNNEPRGFDRSVSAVKQEGERPYSDFTTRHNGKQHNTPKGKDRMQMGEGHVDSSNKSSPKQQQRYYGSDSGASTSKPHARNEGDKTQSKN